MKGGTTVSARSNHNAQLQALLVWIQLTSPANDTFRDMFRLFTRIRVQSPLGSLVRAGPRLHKILMQEAPRSEWKC
jgi:hypothetical protein